MRRQIIPQLFCWLVVLAGVADVVVGVGSSAMADQQSDSPQEQVRQAAEEYGCDPALLWAIQRSECDFENPKDCMSSVGAMGPFQFMPGTLEMLGESQADVWSYYGSGVVACEFVLFLGLQEQKSLDDFVFVFADPSWGFIWNEDVPQATQVYWDWQYYKTAGF
ncbi:hypothetical protein A2368_01785 [Candidatus Collierbacteria bacterium RIFOXYB1_FULL_49_13]|uniref:Transglycosylase SLT domain-containing protein n=1 Tax=Candidatus Collierbacteria bacterium RIFOXYB1_FULL_49_13 TaxID=1817728 RepID=A0A1F5FIF7_9BACT|nr:MAG: hypothetical protein A2368_01785 [Candidatus Collierbacteria bacterium RIFOXYB1_FULL_49_13]